MTSSLSRLPSLRLCGMFVRESPPNPKDFDALEIVIANNT